MSSTARRMTRNARPTRHTWFRRTEPPMRCRAKLSCPAGFGGFEKIAGAANRLQVNGIFRIGLDLFAQATDIDVDTARRDEAFGAPDGVEQLVSREDAVGPRRQIVDETKLQRAQCEHLARAQDAIRRRIDQ